MKLRNRLVMTGLLAGVVVLSAAVPALAFGGGTGGGFGGGGGGGSSGGGFSGGGGGFGGGGFGFPLFLPFFGFGGGGLLPIVIFLAFLWLSRQSAGGGGQMGTANPSDATLIRLEIGLLATAKEIPTALHNLVESVDTSTNTGLSQLLQQAALLLLRNQQYWHAASYTYRKVRFREVESSFNTLTMQARSKLSYETITNVNGVRQEDKRALLPAGSNGQSSASEIPPGDYIVVVLVVASSAPLQLRQAVTADDVRDQVAEIAAAAGSNLLGVEVIWQPDSPTEALSRDDLVSWYPELAPI
ncbi:MAG TPA: DUF1517 domain-containing protein [Chloroflexota bacterium]|nr:DUF1517 domain-containing protein [Chloroflexota bacterium]